jgi:hypothetical protein
MYMYMYEYIAYRSCNSSIPPPPQTLKERYHGISKSIDVVRMNSCFIYARNSARRPGNTI